MSSSSSPVFAYYRVGVWCLFVAMAADRISGINILYDFVSSDKATKFAGNVGGRMGEQDLLIVPYGRAHIELLYNSGCGDDAKQIFMNIG